QLRYSSAEIKDKDDKSVSQDLQKILTMARPKFIYTHNLADKHDTHVAVALRVIQAIRALPKEDRPEALYGCEVWRGLDWLCDSEKLVFDVSGRDNIAAALAGVYDSQIAGGKRYDLAVTGRRLANATFLASHAVDKTDSAIYAVNMTPLIRDDKLSPAEFILSKVDNFYMETKERVLKYSV
ncbi:MAG: PIG-L family deacetylase, partial [Clostridiales bacterium]|nr:PIG-L family deacetylase [Clostridiales bacterium]